MINIPFKEAVRQAFGHFMHTEFERYMANGGPNTNPVLFNPKMGMTLLKPVIVVTKGIEALNTPVMKAAIAKAFQEDGRFAEICGEERQRQAERAI